MRRRNKGSQWKPHRLDVFLKLATGTSGREQTDIADVLRNAKPGQNVRVPLLEAHQMRGTVPELITSKQQPPCRKPSPYGEQTFVMGRGNLPQARCYHGTSLSGALGMLKTPMWTMSGGAGSNTLRKKFGKEFPVTYFAPNWETAMGYANGHPPERVPTGPKVTVVMETLIDCDDVTGAPRLYLRMKRKSGTNKGEQWLAHPGQAVHLAMWFIVHEATDWDSLSEVYSEKDVEKLSRAELDVNFSNKKISGREMNHLFRGQEICEVKVLDREWIEPLTMRADSRLGRMSQDEREKARASRRARRRSAKSGGASHAGTDADDEESSEEEVYNRHGENILDPAADALCFSCEQWFQPPSANFVVKDGEATSELTALSVYRELGFCNECQRKHVVSLRSEADVRSWCHGQHRQWTDKAAPTYMLDGSGFYSFTTKVQTFNTGSTGSECNQTNVTGLEFNNEGKISQIIRGRPADRDGRVKLDDQLCRVDGWWLPPPKHPRFAEMLKHLKSEYFGIMQHRVREGSTIELLLSRPVPPGESDSSPSMEPTGSGQGQSAPSEVEAAAPVDRAPADSGVHLLKDCDGNEAGLALGTRPEAIEMAAAIQRGPNSRGGVHVVEEAIQPETGVPVHSPTSVAPSVEEPTSPAEGTLVPDKPEEAGSSEAVAPTGLNVSVASGAVITPSGAAVVSTEPVKDENDSMPNFSEEEEAPR